MKPIQLKKLGVSLTAVFAVGFMLVFQVKAQGVSPTPPADNFIRYPRVFYLIFNPILENRNNQKLIAYKHWQDPFALSQQYTDAVRQSSYGMINYQITGSREVDDIPLKADGFDYTDDSYLNCIENNIGCHNGQDRDYANYNKIITDYGICEMVNRGEIDELWMMGGPWFGFFEANMAGRGGFWTNGPVINGTTCNKPIHIMGFNYERGYELMLHDLGHRTEGTMDNKVGDAENSTGYSWGDFRSNPFRTYGNTILGCGDIHYAPNSPGEGVYNSQNNQRSNCEDWLNYPSFTSSNTDINCNSWNCWGGGYFQYWLTHLPHAAGRDNLNHYNNWWKYITNSSFDYPIAVTMTPVPTATVTPFVTVTPQPAPDINTGLLYYYPMDEKSWVNDCQTGTVKDKAGSANGRSCPYGAGPVSGVAGKFGNSGNFDGVDDYVYLYNKSIPSRGNGTVSMWVYPQSQRYSESDLISSGVVGNDFRFLVNWAGGTSLYGFYINREYRVTTYNTPPLNQWTLITFTWGSLGSKLYFNGIIQNSKSLAPPKFSQSGVNIGRDLNFYNAFKGKIDDLRMYTRALTDSDVSYLASYSPLGPTPSSAPTVTITPTILPSLTPGATVTPTMTSVPSATPTPTRIPSPTSAPSNTPSPTPPADNFIRYPRVFYLIFNPILENRNNQKLIAYKHWQDPFALSQQYTDAVRQSSYGMINYQITGSREVDDIPLKADGFDYTDDSYLNCIENNIGCHNGPGQDYTNYNKIITDYGICEMVNRGEIDELWMMGGPWFGFYEANMAGPGGFWTNGPVINGTICNKPIHIMGFNYERGYELMLHDLGHRSEGTMDNKVGYTKNSTGYSWGDFRSNPFNTFGNTVLGCGDIHYTSNSPGAYIYNSQNNTRSNCEDWLNYPSFTGSNTDINCNSWTCGEAGHYQYWFSHLPHASGTDNLGHYNNWWRYITNSSFDFPITVTMTPAPTATVTPFVTATPQPPPDINTGLLYYYPMDELSWVNDCQTGTVVDYASSANARSCPYNAGPLSGVTGKFGNAGYFDGVDDYVYMYNQSIPSGGTGTVSMWVYPETQRYSETDLISSGPGGNDFRFLVNWNGGTSRYGFYISGEYRVATYIAPSLNQWTLITLTWGSSGSKLYFNGALQNTNTIIPPIFTPSGVNIGTNISFSNAFKGKIDDVRMYTRVLNDSDVLYLYSYNPLGPTSSSVSTATITPTILPSLTPGATVTPTMTSVPSATPTPTRIPSPTSAPSNTPFPTSSALRGITGDLWADKVLGQPDFAQEIPGELVSFKTAGPGGVTVDRSVHPNRVYIFDGMNSRILGYSSLGVCANDGAKSCTSDSDCNSATCTVQVGGETGAKKADLVIGQPTFNTSACNGDGTWLSYPYKAPASASTLCSMPENIASPYEYGSFSSMVTDSAGNLFVADPFNHRILKYNSPFTTDNIADEVWGQDNFANTKANKGLFPPNATTLSLINSSPRQTLTIGIDLDPAGNLWVTDPNNNRVLRYPKGENGIISKSADLVLGQPDFSSYTLGNSLSKMYNPSGIGVHPDGRVFVADTENDRVLVFSPPFTNGQAATQFGSGFRSPNEVDFENNPSGTSLPVGIWIQDSRNSQLVMFDGNANPVKVLHKNSYSNDGNCNYVCESRGSVGFTSDGDIISANGFNGQNAYFFKHPIPLAGSQVYRAQYTFFSPPWSHNYLSDKGFASARGLAVSNNQVIVADQKRIMYWNTPNGIADLSAGKPSDGVAGVADFKTFAEVDFGRLEVDKNNNLWVAHNDTLEHYSLPLTFGEMPDAVINTKDFQFLGTGTPVGISFSVNDIAIDPQGKYLWMAIPGKDRVIRVRKPANLSGPYIIDVIIGGPDILTYTHAWGDDCAGTVANYPNSLCFPGSVSMDQNGNIFISDSALEFFGDHYLFRYDKSIFPENNSSLLVYYPGDAAQKLPEASNWQAAFDSQNRMVLGFARYTSFYQGQIGFVDDVYSHANTPITMDEQHLFTDRYAQPYTIKFDDDDNLYVADLNWGRVLVYANPFNNPPRPTFTPAPTVTITPFITATPQPTPNINTGLLYYFPMDELSWVNDCQMGTVIDFASSANARSCPYNAGPLSGVTGKFGNAGYFDGVDDYVYMYNQSIPSGGTGTVSMWVYPETQRYSETDLISSGPGGNDFRFLVNWNGGTSRYGFYISGEYRVATYIAPSLNQWTLITLTWGSSGSKLYFNGALQNTNTIIPPIFTPSGVNIGRNISFNAFKGKIDDVRMYTRALNDIDVLYLYSYNPLGPTPSSDPTATITPTILPSLTPTSTIVPTLTQTPTPTSAITLTPTPTNIPTPSPSFTPTPTGISPTFTPTQTPTPVSNSLNINYMYSGVWTDVGNQTLAVALYQGATLIKKENVIAGNIGGETYQAKLYGTPVGVYDIVIKTDRHLSRRNKGVNLKTGNNYSVFTNSLLPGDINAGLGAGSDNVIDLLDYNRLSSEVGGAGKASDLDYDGTVNSLDYSILIQNFGFVGE